MVSKPSVPHIAEGRTSVELVLCEGRREEEEDEIQLARFLDNMTATRVKCVVVGDGAAGKTNMILAFRSNEYGSFSYPSTLDNFSKEVVVDGTEVELSVWDTYGQMDYSRLRPLIYPDTDVFLIVFSVDNGDSLENIREVWYPEVSYFCPGTPIIVVGTKCDLRHNPPAPNDLRGGQRLLPYSEGLTVMKDIGAVQYIECSSLTQQGLEKVFKEAARTVLDVKQVAQNLQARRSQRSCSML